MPHSSTAKHICEAAVNIADECSEIVDEEHLPVHNLLHVSIKYALNNVLSILLIVDIFVSCVK